MAAAEVPVAANPIEQIPDFIHEIFYPSPLTSFRESMPSGELEVHLHRSQGEPVQLRLINMFPFMTLQDIKVALFIELRREPIAVPDNIYLCLHGSEPGKRYIGGQTAPLDFSWNFPNISVAQPLRIAEPFKLVTGGVAEDARFVDPGGERRLVSLIDRRRMTIEDACFRKRISNGIPVIHAYLYSDLLAALRSKSGSNPPSIRDWNGRLYPIFPHLSASSGPEGAAADIQEASRLALIFARKQQFLVRLESILESGQPLVALTMAGIKHLQLTWDTKRQIQGIETQFYEADVSERRPFVRLIPTEGSGISKVYLADGKSPDIQDPKLLIQWAQDRSPTPEQDFAFAKIMLRKGLMNVPPIYATLRLFNDGTADCVVEPPKGVKKLEPRNDLESFGDQLVEGLRGLPYLSTMPELQRGIFVLGLRLRKGEDAVISPRILRERLPIFSAMFQEISALPGERPLVMLRFKLVSNFAREDRIQTFLTQVIQRKVLRGEGGVADLVALVADEFQIDEDEARKQVAIKLQAQGEVSMVVPETKEYMRENNFGIDVAIFAQHPFYTFHIYNVNSLENLQRIVTALSLLMSASTEDLQVGAKAVKELVTAEAWRPPVEEEKEAVAEAAAEAAAEAPAAAAAAPVEEAEDVAGAEDMPDYLDFFAFDQGGEELTLEEAHQKEVEAAAAMGAAARPDFPAGAEDSAKAIPKTSQDLRKGIAAATVSPKEELATLAPAAAAQENEDQPASTETGIANFFLNKLKEADSRLFDYTKSNPSLKRYVSQCQPTYGRQPAVLSEEKFMEIQEEYAKDNVAFQIYPLQPGEPEKLPGMPERDYYTVLKYGSSPQRQNYYLCCRYFCIRDEMLIREAELRGTVMRRPAGAPKQPGECPFCKGRVISNRRAPGPNETIMERVIKPPTPDKRHLYIGFIKKTPHPEGFYLPCCFTEDVPIKFRGNPAFDKYKEWGLSPSTSARPVSAAAAAVLEDEDEDEEPVIGDAYKALDYTTTLNQISKKYIVGAEKLPLDISPGPAGRVGEAQIGLLPTILNSYFDQDPTQLVTRAFNPQKIKPDGQGFLRIAVENRHRFQADSFLAAVAPLYGKNTADQMKRHIIESIQPKEFLSLNYGNLAIEFYDPADSVIKPPAQEALRLWASKFLQVDMQEENEEVVRRAYMSYHTFVEWLLSDKTKKEYRHFALLFAQSNILRRSYPKGLSIIVLDILKNGQMNVRCPPYGFNTSVMNRNDVAFVLHHWSGIWEPIFFVDNREFDVRSDNIYTMVFQYTARASWPPIVQQRLGEYMAQCNSSGRAIYTSQSKVHSLAMIPASFARVNLEKDPNIVFDGILRDAYNHIGALLFHERGDAAENMIALPVVDDGELIVGKTLVLDWEDPAFRPAPVEKVLIFYKKYVETRFSYYPGFVPTYIIKSTTQGGGIIAIQLRNGLYVPVSPPSSEEAAKGLVGAPTRMVSELEWTKNHEISLKEAGVELPGDNARMEISEFQEIFEHLRLTFSNWLAAKDDAGEFRKRLEEVIFSHKLPLYERRKRMEILLSREVEKWITTDFSDEDAAETRGVSLLRVDCSVRGEDSCGGRCVWKRAARLSEEEEEEEEEPGGRCMLHVPKETRLGEEERKVSAPRVLLFRLIEELLRYGERRKQLLEQGVARLASLDKPIMIQQPGGISKQVIYPEKSAAWYELLRLEWSKTIDEKPKFLEELSKERSEGALAEQLEETALPERLVTIMNGPGGPHPKTSAIRLLRAPFEALLVPLRVTPAEIGVTKETVALDDTMLRKIVEETGGVVIQFDLREDPVPPPVGRKPIRSLYDIDAIPIFVITDEGPALLVKNPSAPEILKKGDMPPGLLATVEETLAKTKGILKLRLKAPAAPAAAAAAEPKRQTLAEFRAAKAAAKSQLPAPALAELPEGEPPAFPEPPPPDDSA